MSKLGDQNKVAGREESVPLVVFIKLSGKFSVFAIKVCSGMGSCLRKPSSLKTLFGFR